MKPCSKNRKRIAWLALDALDARQAAALHDHLASCEGCRRYWQEISTATERLAAAAPDSNLEASELFHHRVAEKLPAVQSGSLVENLAAWLRGSALNWRIALPVVAVLVFALLAMVARRHLPVVSVPTPPAVQSVAASGSESALAPTLANYQRVANQSLEKLSELLNRQGNKRLPPAPVYTVSSFELANAWF